MASIPGTSPQSIGRYEIRRELGRGMMGVVYEAHDPVLGRTIALKVIQLAFAVTEGERKSFEERFLAEARVAARLSHPGIVVVHDVGQDPATGLLYIALEFLRGRTLAEVVASVAIVLGHRHRPCGVIVGRVAPVDAIGSVSRP